MPMYISRVTSEVVMQEAGGLSREQMGEIVAEVMRALKEQEQQCVEVERATKITENNRPESQFE